MHWHAALFAAKLVDLLELHQGTQKLCLPVAQHEQIGSELGRHCSMAWFGSSKGELGLLAAGLATL
jgi:hypothetical protein